MLIEFEAEIGDIHKIPVVVELEFEAEQAATHECGPIDEIFDINYVFLDVQQPRGVKYCLNEVLSEEVMQDIEDQARYFLEEI